MTADIIALPLPQRRPLPRKAQPGIHRRIEEIGRVLELPAWEINRAAADFGDLLEFVRKYNQSSDWVCFGNPAPMIRRLASGR